RARRWSRVRTTPHTLARDAACAKDKRTPPQSNALPGDTDERTRHTARAAVSAAAGIGVFGPVLVLAQVLAVRQNGAAALHPHPRPRRRRHRLLGYAQGVLREMDPALRVATRGGRRLRVLLLDASQRRDGQAEQVSVVRHAAVEAQEAGP